MAANDSATSLPTSLTSDTERDLRAQLALLKEALANKEKECAALESLVDEQAAALKANADKKSAAKIVKGAFAKVQLLGEGRRVIAPGEALNSAECDGLIEGVHYQLVG